eukprot:scaffold33466_cov73-Skeletonema_marinoi.AAC.1
MAISAQRPPLDCFFWKRKKVVDGFGLNSKNRQLQLLQTSTSFTKQLQTLAPQKPSYQISRKKQRSSSTEHIIIDHHSRQWGCCWTRQGKISPRPYASTT